jgi:hypothetical protein
MADTLTEMPRRRGLAIIVPPWVTAGPVILLSAALAIAVVRDPRGAGSAADTLGPANPT